MLSNQFWGPCYNNQILTGDFKVTRASTTTCYVMIFFNEKLSHENLLEKKLPDLRASVYH